MKMNIFKISMDWGFGTKVQAIGRCSEYQIIMYKPYNNSLLQRL